MHQTQAGESSAQNPRLGHSTVRSVVCIVACIACRAEMHMPLCVISKITMQLLTCDVKAVYLLR